MLPATSICSFTAVVDPFTTGMLCASARVAFWGWNCSGPSNGAKLSTYDAVARPPNR
jgi:hypothetical protein